MILALSQVRMQAIVKVVEPNCQEKLLSLIYIYPYRKPTRVDEERILRWTGEQQVKELGKKSGVTSE